MRNCYTTIRNIFCENSLETPIKWKKETQKIISPNSYDIVLTNPPFSAKIPVVGEHLLKQYKLGQFWKNRLVQKFSISILSSKLRGNLRTLM